MGKLVGGWDDAGTYRQLQEGGLVTETGLAMLHGTIPKPELVLDNQAASLFMEAAMIIKGIDLSGLNLANLQRDSVSTMQATVSAPIVVNAPSTTQINSSQGVMMPLAPIRPSNGESSLS